MPLKRKVVCWMAWLYSSLMLLDFFRSRIETIILQPLSAFFEVLRGIDAHPRKINKPWKELAISSDRATLEEKNLLPSGANSFLEV